MVQAVVDDVADAASWQNRWHEPRWTTVININRRYSHHPELKIDACITYFLIHERILITLHPFANWPKVTSIKRAVKNVKAHVNAAALGFQLKGFVFVVKTCSSFYQLRPATKYKSFDILAKESGTSSIHSWSRKLGTYSGNNNDSRDFWRFCKIPVVSGILIFFVLKQGFIHHLIEQNNWILLGTAVSNNLLDQHKNQITLNYYIHSIWLFPWPTTHQNPGIWETSSTFQVRWP